jgi:hypothetical protein
MGLFGMIINKRAESWKLEGRQTSWKEGLSIPEKNRDGNVWMSRMISSSRRIALKLW